MYKLWRPNQENCKDVFKPRWEPKCIICEGFKHIILKLRTLAKQTWRMIFTKHSGLRQTTDRNTSEYEKIQIRVGVKNVIRALIRTIMLGD